MLACLIYLVYRAALWDLTYSVPVSSTDAIKHVNSRMKYGRNELTHNELEIDNIHPINISDLSKDVSRQIQSPDVMLDKRVLEANALELENELDNIETFVSEDLTENAQPLEPSQKAASKLNRINIKERGNL